MEGQSKENMELRGLKEEDVKDRNKWRHANPMKEQKKKKGDAQFILTAYTKYEATSWAGFDTTNSCQLRGAVHSVYPFWRSTAAVQHAV